MKNSNEEQNNFENEVKENIKALEKSDKFYKQSMEWINSCAKFKYTYNLRKTCFKKNQRNKRIKYSFKKEKSKCYCKLLRFI